eukprot:362856-Chlamydomonas_euryale.AAC.13
MSGIDAHSLYRSAHPCEPCLAAHLILCLADNGSAAVDVTSAHTRGTTCIGLSCAGQSECWCRYTSLKAWFLVNNTASLCPCFAGANVFPSSSSPQTSSLQADMLMLQPPDHFSNNASAVYNKLRTGIRLSLRPSFLLTCRPSPLTVVPSCPVQGEQRHRPAASSAGTACHVACLGARIAAGIAVRPAEAHARLVARAVAVRAWLLVHLVVGWAGSAALAAKYRPCSYCQNTRRQDLRHNADRIGTTAQKRVCSESRCLDGRGASGASRALWCQRRRLDGMGYLAAARPAGRTAGRRVGRALHPYNPRLLDKEPGEGWVAPSTPKYQRKHRQKCSSRRNAQGRVDTDSWSGRLRSSAGLLALDTKEHGQS